jgi:hypothetical protein
MKRMLWVTQVAFCLIVLGTLSGGAWANLVGNANVTQITQGVAFSSGGGSRTFLIGESVTFQALYYDANPACDGVAPALVQLFIFTQEGVLLGPAVAASTIPGSTAFGPTFSKYRLLTVSLPATGAGDFRFTFLVQDCTVTKTIALPDLVPVRVIAP